MVLLAVRTLPARLAVALVPTRLGMGLGAAPFGVTLVRTRFAVAVLAAPIVAAALVRMAVAAPRRALLAGLRQRGYRLRFVLHPTLTEQAADLLALVAGDPLASEVADVEPASFLRSSG